MRGFHANSLAKEVEMFGSFRLVFLEEVLTDTYRNNKSSLSSNTMSKSLAATQERVIEIPQKSKSPIPHALYNQIFPCCTRNMYYSIITMFRHAYYNAGMSIRR